MNRIVKPGSRSGIMQVPASKSEAHRMLICAALSRQACILEGNGLSNDILATADCLNALISDIRTDIPGQITVRPAGIPASFPVQLRCRESGSTLRFLLPVTGALGAEAVFYPEGRLPDRPMDDLVRVCEEHGMRIEKSGMVLKVSGQLQPGHFRIRGDVSSQYITGLLFALPLLAGDSTLEITGRTESAGYLLMTENALTKSGIRYVKQGNLYQIPGRQHYRTAERILIEKDWSGAAFPLCMGAFSEGGVGVDGLSESSLQGDRKILEVLAGFGAKITKDAAKNRILVRKGLLRGQEIDVSDIPDLAPVICVVAAAAEGPTTLFHAGRLRMKESDRISSTVSMLKSLGASVSAGRDSITVAGGRPLTGGLVDPQGDHRIAMAAAVAAGICRKDIVITDADCCEKSFPDFWKELDSLSCPA